jgi:hypothetical protein
MTTTTHPLTGISVTADRDGVSVSVHGLTAVATAEVAYNLGVLIPDTDPTVLSFTAVRAGTYCISTITWTVTNYDNVGPRGLLHVKVTDEVGITSFAAKTVTASQMTLLGQALEAAARSHYEVTA